MSRGLLAFVAGLGIGSGVGYILTKKKIESKCQAEIQEMREYLYRELEIAKKKDDKGASDQVVDDIPKNASTGLVERQNGLPVRSNDEVKLKTEYSEMVKGYTAEECPVEVSSPDYIWPISNEDYYEDGNRDKVVLSYFKDNVFLITDVESGNRTDIGKVLEDAERYVGLVKEIEDVKGEYEDFTSFIHNEKYNTDYQILFEPNAYESYLEGLEEE